jgi:hypothetical protein
VAAGPKNIYMKEFYDYFLKKIDILKKEHSEEISRLRDQIYIRQNAFNEYISFNSINTNYKTRELTRHIPLNIYIGSEKKEVIQLIHDKLLALVDVLGFRFYNPNKKLDVFSERICVSREEITISDVYAKFYSLFNAINDKVYISPQFKKVVEDFMKEMSKIHEISLKIGSLLIVKPGPDEQHEVIAMKLSISNMIHLDKNPELLTKPDQLLKELHCF